MDLKTLIAELSRPGAFPAEFGEIEIRQTHISVVFLGNSEVYKIKKPVSLGFLDFTSLEQRQHFCEEEVRLNRRMAPAVYFGVVPITGGKNGLRVGGDGHVVEWAVRMRRLPDEAMLGERLRRGEGGFDLMRLLAARLAEFHRTAERGRQISNFGRHMVVAGNARENFQQSIAHIGRTVTQRVHDRARLLTEEALLRLQSLIERRADGNCPCDTHGDLHLDHIYWFPDRKPPDDLVMIDCIEFSERFRYADPIADVAFVAMDLCFQGRGDVAREFARAYLRESADSEGVNLLPFYLSYRSAVRAKVEGMKAGENEVPSDQREDSIRLANAHWLLCLSTLEEPAKRPCLLLIGGLPGTGKTTLARGLMECAAFTLIRSDVVRKELADSLPRGESERSLPRDIYTNDWTDQTYKECLRRARESLTDGGRVIVDATFVDDAHRKVFFELAQSLCVPAAFLECRADPALIAKRLEARRGDASDATLAVHQKLASRWQSPTPMVSAHTTIVVTDDRATSLESALGILRSMELL